MYVVITRDFDELADIERNTVATLETAFARIVCMCGYSYQFEPTADGWRLVLTDVERLDCSPEPVLSDYKKMDDAKHDLLAQAVDGRLKGYVAVPFDAFKKRRVEFETSEI